MARIIFRHEILKKISKTKIRGEDSEGMLCSEKEIGIGNDEKGIIILKDNKIKKKQKLQSSMNKIVRSLN